MILQTFFVETQRYPTWLILFALIAILLIGVVLRRKFKQKWMLAIFVMIPFLFIGYFASITMTTKIDDAGIGLQLWPAEQQQQLINWKDISNIKFKNRIIYSRTRFLYDVYAVYNSCGIYVTTTSGKKYIIGTRQPNEIALSIRKHYKYVKQLP